MNLTAEELEKNYEKLLSTIDEHITGERKEKLKKLYTDHMERIMLMPAASVDHHHNTFAGGYVDHINRVVTCALNIRKLWLASGATEDHTAEELVFAAINHDLGKIGSEEAEQYQLNDSEWHRKNLGKIYKHNTENPFMTVPDRGLFLLQARGISVSFNEYLGIKLHDGLYEDANKPYYISHAKESKLRTNLPIILHHADHMAARIEYEKWAATQTPTSTPAPRSTAKKAILPENLSQNQKDDLMNVFNGLFK